MKGPNRAIPIEKWLAIETDYIQGKGTLESLAVKHGMVDSTVKNRCQKHGWHMKRREYEHKRAQAAICTQPGLIPPMDAADSHVSRLKQELNPAFFLEENKKYFKNGLGLLEKAEKAIRRKLDILASIENPDFEELTGATRALDTLLERRRIILGIPLVAPIKRVEKNTKRGGDLVPIEVYETPNPSDVMPVGVAPVGAPVMEMEEVQEMPPKPGKPVSPVPETEVEDNWA